MNQILSTRDLMKRMNCGRDKAYRLMHSSCFPSIKIAGSYLVTEDALKRWLEENEGREILV